jgi:hypothetical protein
MKHLPLQIITLFFLCTLAWTALLPLSDSVESETIDAMQQEERAASEGMTSLDVTLHIMQLAAEIQIHDSACLIQNLRTAPPPLAVRGRGSWFSHYHSTVSPPLAS